MPRVKAGRAPREENALSLYSRVDRRLWNDARFRRLSKAPPNAQTLFIRLLTGPELGPIPGLFAAWEGGLANALGWTSEQFRERFRELSQERMAEGDWDAGLVFLPNAIKRNPPTSPNHILGWARTWNELPECDLKTKAYWHLKAYVDTMPEPFRDAYRDGIPEPIGDPRSGIRDQGSGIFSEREDTPSGTVPGTHPGTVPPSPEAEPSDQMPPDPETGLPVVDQEDAAGEEVRSWDRYAEDGPPDVPAAHRAAPGGVFGNLVVLPVDQEPQAPRRTRWTGMELARTFGVHYAQVLNGIPWHAKSTRAVDEWARGIDPSHVDEVEGTMVEALKRIKARAAGWQGDSLEEPRVAFAAWMDGFSRLVAERLGMKTQRVAAKPAGNGQPQRRLALMPEPPSALKPGDTPIGPDERYAIAEAKLQRGEISEQTFHNMTGGRRSTDRPPEAVSS